MRSFARLIQNASNLLSSERCQASKGASFPCERCRTRQHTFLMYKVCFNELQHGETRAPQPTSAHISRAVQTGADG